jgi:mannose-6-phosphate isomerase-like protein (cupin superfamily)
MGANTFHAGPGAWERRPAISLYNAILEGVSRRGRRVETSGEREIWDFRPGLPMTWEILRTAREGDAGEFEAVNRLDPRMEGPPVHIHPSAQESYEVRSGTLDVFIDGEWRRLEPGQKAVVPAGVPHTLKNDSDQEVEIVNVHSPALRFESFFRQMHRLTSQGKMALPPKNPRSLIYVGTLFSSYPEEIRVVKPPPAVFNALGFIGRRLGYTVDER